MSLSGRVNNKRRTITWNTINRGSTFHTRFISVIFPSCLAINCVSLKNNASNKNSRSNFFEMEVSRSRFVVEVQPRRSVFPLLKIPVVRFWNALKFGFHFVRFIEIVPLSLHITEQITSNPLCHVGEESREEVCTDSILFSFQSHGFYFARDWRWRLLFSSLRVEGKERGSNCTRKVSPFFRE